MVIKNGTVVTMDENRKEKFENVDIIIRDDKIIDITKNYNGGADKVIDATDKVVIPGLINSHTHLGMSIFRATNDNLNLNDWLNKKIWPIEDNMSEDDIYYTTLLSCVEMIKTGTTCSNDMYFGKNGALNAIKKAKVRSLFTRTLMDSDGNGKMRLDEFLDLYNNNKDNDLINFTVAPHAVYTCSESYLKECSNLALKLNIPLHIHFCENESEVFDIKKKYHCDPIILLKKLGLTKNKLILAHCTFLNPKKLKYLKDHDISIVHNPISNLNLGCGVADIIKYKDFANICLGTDGQGSGNNLNMFYHMSVVDLLQKGYYKDPTIYSSYETLKLATINGAKALGLDNEIGSIKVGKKADIVILDMNKTETYPTVDLITNIVHNVIPSNVETTIINGNILMENRKLLLDIDEDDLKNNIKNIIDKLSI